MYNIINFVINHICFNICFNGTTIVLTHVSIILLSKDPISCRKQPGLMLNQGALSTPVHCLSKCWIERQTVFVSITIAVFAPFTITCICCAETTSCSPGQHYRSHSALERRLCCPLSFFDS